MRQNRRAFVRNAAVAGVTLSLAGGLHRDGGAGAGGGDDSWLPEDERVDDWEYYGEATRESGGWTSPGGAIGSYFQGATVDEAAPAMDDADDSIGLAAGGAADVATYRRNLREGYLPIPESITHEGLYHEYYFDTEGSGCSTLFCPQYTPAVSRDPLSDDTRRYLSVGLDSGLSKDDFERPPLNLVVVLDISGSMNASFSEYYYDRYGGQFYIDEHGNRQEVEETTPKPKIEVAREALSGMTHNLRPDDHFGVVLFNNEAHLAKPLRRVGDTDMEAIRGHVREEVDAGGGTNISAGMELAQQVIDDAGGGGDEGYETRSVMITDAQINWGETDADELGSTLRSRASDGHHASVVGVGVDFNAELIREITDVRGANYYSVYGADEFRRRMDDEFRYMVSPLVYDLRLELHASGWRIHDVYGSPGDHEDGEMMHVDTLFPSPSRDGEAKGGVVLVEVEREEDAGALELEASWTTHEGREETESLRVDAPTGEPPSYGAQSTRKAIALARYVDLVKEWTAYERSSETDGRTGYEEPPEVDTDEPITPPRRRSLGEWEQRSQPLTVSPPYRERLGEFKSYLETEIQEIGDEDLRQELEMLELALEA